MPNGVKQIGKKSAVRYRPNDVWLTVRILVALGKIFRYNSGRKVALYSRPVTEPPERIIQHGVCMFGTFAGFPQRLDIRNMHAPFGGIPFPYVLTNIRIRSSLLFTFSIGSYIGTVEFFDQKIFGYAEVLFWNKETGRKYAYRSFMGPRRRFIPHSLVAGYCATFRKKRYIRVSWDHNRDRLSLIFNMQGDSARPAANAAFLAHFRGPNTCEMTAVVPSPTRSRCNATYTCAAAIHGALSLEKNKHGEAVPMEKTDGDALLNINRSYYNFISACEICLATGTVGGRHVSFKIVMQAEESVDSDTINENLLFVDGHGTPLPPVVITHSFGLAENWVIQDTENMVDLTFTPCSDHFRDNSFFVARTQVHTILGKFEGVLKTKDNEPVVLHNFEGIVRKQMLRL